MEELVGRLVANVGVERGAAEKAVAIILDFLRKEGPTDKVQALIDRLPGAEALLSQHTEGSGGIFPMGGIMGAGTYARDKIGDDAVGEIVGAIPGLSQFV